MPTNRVAFKERDVRRAIRGALKEDLQVSGYEIMRDGTIRVMTVSPGDATEPARPSPPGGAAA